MPNPIELKTPDASLAYQFDWTPQLSSDITLVSVKHQAPQPVVVVSELTDTIGGVSVVEISGGVHGGVYLITAAATLSDGEIATGRFVLRVMQPAGS